MIFSELYSAYYNTVAKVLKAAVSHPLDKSEMEKIIGENAFGESILSILPALAGQRWQLLRQNGTTPLMHSPSMPLTTLEKRWLAAIYSDPRTKLFTDETVDFHGVIPLFSPDDYSVFDKYSDGDPYGDENYIKNFRLILDAIQRRFPLGIETENRRGNRMKMVLIPEYLEYSEKDDKFRLFGSGNRQGGIVNLGRIISCEPYSGPFEIKPIRKPLPRTKKLEFELTDIRSALERVLMHFAHFEKQVEKTAYNKYKVTLFYEKDDETELVIRVLSFGPMIRVTSPQHFVDLIKERLKSQKSCEP
ncbi:MAG: WYL domain-containing protein [Clostridia bacterium]|nr:WYL domain-containing protein [Clostridia bacterium]